MSKKKLKARKRFVEDFTKAYARAREAGLEPYELSHGVAQLVGDAVALMSADEPTVAAILNNYTLAMQTRAFERFRSTNVCDCEACTAARQLINSPAAGRA